MHRSLPSLLVRGVQPLRPSLRERPVEVDRGVRAVAERLVAGLAASAQRHLLAVLDDAAVRRHQPDRTGHYVRAVLTGDDRHIWHGRLLSTYSKGLADRQPADPDTGTIEHRVGDRRRHEGNADLSDT